MNQENCFESPLNLIGNTPLVRLNKIAPNHYIYAKCEFLNPSGSIKDRAAKAMIETAQKEGKIKEGTLIVEATSGNTGIGLAQVCAAKGYPIVLTMPESMSLERRKILIGLGAKLELTPAHLGMQGAIEKAFEIQSKNNNVFIPSQFDNPANPETHRQTTAPEIWRDTNGKIDCFIAGVGTGGTMTGVGEVLKQKNPAIQCIAMEPSESAVLSGKPAGPHMIQGIGAGFIPKNLNQAIIDEIVTVTNEAAFSMARKLHQEEGLLVGISSGANVHAACELAKRPDMKGKMIVTILCDYLERYLSTTLLEETK